MQKIRKSNEPILRRWCYTRTHGRTDRRTDRRTDGRVTASNTEIEQKFKRALYIEMGFEHQEYKTYAAPL